MHSDWFNGIDILQGRWQHGEKVGYCYSSGLEKTLCKWEIYVPLVTKGLKATVHATWFHIQKFYLVLTLLLCVLQVLLPCTTLTDWFSVTEVDSVYCAVRTESLYTTYKFCL
jgi:hypothetical protein